MDHDCTAISARLITHGAALRVESTISVNKHRGENAFPSRSMNFRDARDETLDVAKRRVDVAVVKIWSPPGYSISLASGMHAANSRPCSTGTITVALIVKHECRNAHCREDGTDIDLGIQQS